MSNITFHEPLPPTEMRPRISVIGVGGAGCNAVNNMILSSLEGVDFLVANTDAQALGLSQAPAPSRIQLGASLTNGLGAGSEPDIGRSAAEEALDEVMSQLVGSHMVFITAGMGGGTGTGAAPVIARAAREHGILTVGVITKPFDFEGMKRMRAAELGIEELAKFVDTLIVIPNQNLFQIADPRTTLAEAFQMADDVLHSGVRGVTDLMIKPGLINLDFSDIRSVMREMGKATMGTGEAEGEKRAIDAAEAAIDNPLLDDTTMRGAQAVLINITGGLDMTLMEVEEAASRIRQEVDGDANIIFGTTIDEAANGRMRVSVVATGIDAGGMVREPLRIIGGLDPQPAEPATPVDAGPAVVPAPAPTAVGAASPQEPEPGIRPVAEAAPAMRTAYVRQNAIGRRTPTSYARPAGPGAAAVVASPAAAPPAPQPPAEFAGAATTPQPGPDARPAAERTYAPPPPAEPKTRRVPLTSVPPPPPAAREEPPARAARGGRRINLLHLLTRSGDGQQEEQSVQEGSAAEVGEAAPRTEDESQLDIPAFLRRQAN